MKQGGGEERTLVGTIFEGSWDKGRKHGRGVRKMIFGSVDEQVCGSVLLCVCVCVYMTHGARTSKGNNDIIFLLGSSNFEEFSWKLVRRYE